MTRCVLLTGITGFVGVVLAAELLSRFPDCEIVALVRADSESTARTRVADSLVRFLDRRQVESFGPRVSVVAADLMHCEAIDSPWLDRVTEVVHLAANTSLRSVHSVRRVNIDGTLSLLQLVRRCRHLHRMVHVSTAHICGLHPGPVVLEDDFPRPEVDHVAEYTRTKAECEMQIEQAFGDLPLVVARPSVVVGHTQLGCGPSTSIFWYYVLVDRLGVVVSPPDRLKDIVPVDYVARALTRLLFQDDLRYRRYHISAGTGASVTWREMQTEMARCESRSLGPPYQLVPMSRILDDWEHIQTVIGGGDIERVLRALDPFLRFSASGVEVFDNSRLLAEGMSPPPRFTEYLENCLRQTQNRSLYQLLVDDD